MGILEKSVIENRIYAMSEEIREFILAFLKSIHDCPEEILRLIRLMTVSEN